MRARAHPLSSRSTRARCPDEARGEESACGGGVASCREGLGVSGVFCTVCPDDEYKDWSSSACKSCDDVTYSLTLPIVIGVVLLLALLAALAHAASAKARAKLRSFGRRFWLLTYGAGVDTMVKLVWCAQRPACTEAQAPPAPNRHHDAPSALGPRLHLSLDRAPVPLWLCRSFYQVASLVPAVYHVSAPFKVRNMLRTWHLDVDPSLGIGHLLECARLDGFLPSLAFWTLVPPLVGVGCVVSALTLAFCRRRPGDEGWLLDALRDRCLPPLLVVAFVAYTPGASLAMQALDCDELPHPWMEADGWAGGWAGGGGGGGDAAEGGARYLRADYAVECGARGEPTAEYAAIQSWAVAALVLYVVGTPLTTATLLYFARDALSTEQPVPLSRALKFLHKAYEPHVFWWELMEFGRKFMLTGVAVFLRPGSVMQLAFALIVSVTFLALHMEAAPFRLESSDHVAFSIDLFLCFLFFFCLVIKIQVLVETLDASLPYVADGAKESSALFTTNALTVTVLMMVSLLLTLALSTIAFIGNLLKAKSAAHLLRWARDGSAVQARPLLAGRSHCFVSHNWKTGQDQSRSIKSALTSLVPSLRVWLDVDDMRSKAGTKATNTANFGAVIDTTEAMIAFMSGSPANDGGERSDYFLSPPCQQELRRAVSTKTPIIYVHETDPLHGGISLASHVRDCPDDLRPALQRAIDDGEVVEWHRIRAFQDVSLRLIMQRVLCKEAEERGDDTVYVPTEVQRLPLRLAPPTDVHYVPHDGDGGEVPAKKFHVYVSEHNPGASELMAELEDWLTAKRAPRDRKSKSAKAAPTIFRSSMFARSGRENVERTRKMVCGPWALRAAPLEPLGLSATVLPGLNGGTYTLPAADGDDEAAANQAAPMHIGDLSPLAAVTLPPEVRDVVGIAHAALYYAFAYPCDEGAAAAARVEAVASRAGVDAAAASALRRMSGIGGFVYFSAAENGELKLCQAAAMAEAASTDSSPLHFAGPVPLGKYAAVWRDALQRADRLHEVTVPALRAAGVRYFCWLHSNEKVAPCEGEWPDGAFVYFYEKGEGEADMSRQDCVFFLTQGAPEPELQPPLPSPVSAEGKRSSSCGSAASNVGGGDERSPLSTGTGLALSRQGSLDADGFRGLQWTDDPSEVGDCSHVVVYLNGQTHSGAHAAALHAELNRHLLEKRHLVLVHESRPRLGGMPFKAVIDATPHSLVRDDHGHKRLYQELAVPLYAAEHFDVSATLLLGALAGDHHTHDDDAVGRIRRLARRVFRGAVGAAHEAEAAALRASLELAPQTRPQRSSSSSRRKHSRQTPSRKEGDEPLASSSTPPPSDSTSSAPIGALEA